MFTIRLKEVFVDKLRNNTALLVLSGLLLGLSHLHENIWFFSLFGLVPFLHVINNKKFQQKSIGKIFLNGWMFGLIFIGVSIIWFWGAYPLNWILESKQTAIVVVFVVWMVTVLAMSLIFGYLTIVASWCAKLGFWQNLIIPIIWVISEYLQMWLFAILTIAEPALFEPHFSFGFIGYALASNTFLLQFAGFGGVYTLSFIAVAINIGMYSLFKSKKSTTKKKITYLLVGLLFLTITHFVSEQFFTIKEKKIEGEYTNVALLNTYFVRKGEDGALDSDQKYEVYKNLVQDYQSDIAQADIVAFPESANFIERALGSEDIESLNLSTSTIFIDSKIRFFADGETKSTESVYYYTHENGVDFVYDKQFLTPVGEYKPKVLSAFFGLVKKRDEKYQKTVQYLYQKGDTVEHKIRNDRIRTVTLLCSEIASPTLYRKAVEKNDAVLLVNLSSHAYTGRSPILYKQIINMAKVHAVQNGKPFIQATNAAPSFVINKYGMLVAESTRGEESVLFSSIKIEL